MKKHKLETAIPADLSRHIPLASIGEMAKALNASGVVDYLHISDQLMSWFPRDMWTPENTPMAGAIPDIDSFPDLFIMAACALSAAPELGVSLTTDAIRRGPAEIAQSLLSLANLSKRAPIIQMGAGEMKQCKPFGHRRAEGLARLEDHMRAFNVMWEAKEPYDFEGKHTHYEKAWIGNHRGNNKPRFWGLGGAPRFFDVTTSHAEGIGTIIPGVWRTPEQAYASIKALKQQLESKGRDPESFSFGGWFVGAIHDDDAVIDQAMCNPLLRWMMAVFGRLNMADWVAEGFKPPFPLDWHYSMKLLPMEWTSADVHKVIDAVPVEQYNRCMFRGSPKKVAAELQGFVDAGVNWVLIYDFLPIYMKPEEAHQAIGRSIEVCRLLKSANPD